MFACLTVAIMANIEQQIQALTSQVHQLTAQLSSQQQELGNTRAALEQQTQATNAALSVAQSAITQLAASSTQAQAAESRRRPLNPKLVKPPEPFLGTDADWDRFKFSFTSWIGTVDPEYPQLLSDAAAQPDEIDSVDMVDQAEGFCTDLFAILVGLCQAGEIPALAMLVPDRNGFELWRRMHARYEPENKHKPFAWLRVLSNPSFPTKEGQWQRGLEEWEGEIAKYEREYKKVFDPDLKLAILSEVAPKALAPQIAMNSAHLTTHKALREFIVQYLKSKNLWKRGAGTAFGSASASAPLTPYSGPAPMEIGAFDATDAKPKGKEAKGGKGGKKGNPDKGSKGLQTKGDGKGKDNKKGDPSNGKPGKGAPCAICGPEKGKNHSTDACFFNARTNPKGDSKGNKRGPPQNASAEGAIDSDKNVASTISALQSQLDALRVASAAPSQQSAGRKGQGAIQEMLFAISESPVQAVEITEHIAAASSVKYVLVDSGATTSCADEQCFPAAAVDPARQKELWAINGTRIRHKGELTASTAIPATDCHGQDTKIPASFRMDVTDATEPVMALCRILDDADCDLHFYRSSSGKPAHMDTPNGQTVILPRFGARFYMPYEDRHPHHATAEFVAAEIDGDELSIDYSPSEPGSNAAEAALPDSIDVDVEPALPQPAALPVPDAPTDEQRAHHNLTHADFAPWCPHCVAGKAPDAQHRRQNKHEDPEVPVLQVDYQFFSRDGQLVEEESRTATVLTGTDLSSGWPMMAFVPQKGADAYVVRAVVSWVKRLGYAKVVIQHDQEHALRTVVEQVQKELGHDRVQIRAAPRYSHASQGGAENANRLMAGMLRTWLSALNQAYPNPAEPLDINHPVVPWLCRWVAFVWARYHVQSDKLTPYRIVSGRDYATPIVQFGEVVLCKVPNTQSLNKSKPRWFKGLFVGRLELDDSAVILTNAGAITVRSIRRVPAADQYEVSYLNDACGLPWAPSGKRSKVRTQSSNVVAVPIPASDPPAPAPKASGDVQSAQPDVSCPGQICIRPPVMPDAPTSSDSHESRALGPGSGQNSVPGTPLSEARGMTPDSSHRMTMTPPTPPSPFAREIEGPASPFRGSGSMQIERDAPTPTGVNAIPLPSPVHSTDKRPLPQPSEPAAAATESQPKVPKVGTI